MTPTMPTGTPSTAHAQFTPAFAGYAEMVRDSFGRQGLMTTLGARLVTVEPGHCVVELPYSPALSQQQGFFHGGALGAIGDVAAGYAAFSLMPQGAEVLTVDYKINLVRAARPPLVRAEGRVIRAGRTLTVCRAEVFRVDEAGALDICAVLQATMMRVEPAA